MRFPILRRLSLLIHRRAKSEPFAGNTPVEPLDSLTRSFSLNTMAEQARHSGFESSFQQIVLPPPHALHTPPRSPAIVQNSPAFASNTLSPGTHKLAAVSQRILELEYQVNQLKAENDHLKTANNSLRFDAELLQEQLSFLENSERPLPSDARLVKKGVLDNLNATAKRCLQMEKFVRSVVELGLKTEGAVFPRIHEAILAGETHDEAVVQAIRDAAANPDSPWSTLIPAVIGPRTNQQYLSALSMTLQFRRENKDLQAFKKFWKGVAKEDPANTNLITPSTSAISTVQVVLPNDRQRAVDDLLVKLRNGSIPLRGQVLSQAVDSESSLAHSNIVSSSSSIVITASSFPRPPTTRSIATRRTAPPVSEEQRTLQQSESIVSITLPYLNSFSSSLPPLASQRFKEELVASHSSERFYLSISHKRTSRDLAATPAYTVQSDNPYTLPEFPHDLSGSSDLDIFGPSIPSIGSTSDDSSRHAERGSLKTLEEETSQEDVEHFEMVDMTLVNDTITEDVSKSLSPKKSLLPIMKRPQKRNSMVPKTPTKPSLHKTVTIRPSTPSSLKSPSTNRHRPQLQPPPSPTPSSLRKPTISSMKRSIPVPKKPAAVIIKETSPLRIRKKDTTRKRMSPMKRLSRMINGGS